MSDDDDTTDSVQLKQLLMETSKKLSDDIEAPLLNANNKNRRKSLIPSSY